jgi:hypothetical protein
MNEPTKENPKASKRSKRRPAMEPLGWDEIVSQPGMGGYLSFLNGPIPLPHLQGPATAVAPDPGVVTNPHVETTPVAITNPDLCSTPGSVSASALLQEAPIEAIPDAGVPPGVISHSGIKSNLLGPSEPQIASDPVVDSGPRFDIASEVVSIPAVPAGRLRIRRCAATHDGHSLGEEVLYQAIWKAAQPESGETRTIVIGWRGMSQLCRMTPKNCKINTHRLIRKLALEVLSPYNTPESIGTTYRIFSDQAIFERRQAAGLEWVVRSRGVEFVNPATGVSILPICAHTHQNLPR